MPALYPPLVPSLDTPGPEPFNPPLPLWPSAGFFGSRIGVFLVFWIVVDLEAGFAEAVELSGLPQHHRGHGTGNKPAPVEPLRSPDDEKDDGEAHNLDEVGCHKHADGPG